MINLHPCTCINGTREFTQTFSKNMFTLTKDNISVCEKVSSLGNLKRIDVISHAVPDDDHSLQIFNRCNLLLDIWKNADVRYGLVIGLDANKLHTTVVL